MILQVFFAFFKRGITFNYQKSSRKPSDQNKEMSLGDSLRAKRYKNIALFWFIRVKKSLSKTL
jgi:hypothetical protein